MAGRRNDRASDEGQAPGLSWTRRGALAGGLALAPGLVLGAEPAADIPIRLLGNTPWTPVWINKQGPIPFRVRSDTNTFFLSEAFGQQLGMTPQTGEWALTGGSQHKRIVKFYKADQMVVGGQIPMANTRLAILDPVYQRRIDDDGGPTPMNPFAGIVPVPSDRVTTFQWADGLMRLSPALPQDIAAYGKVPLKHYDNDLGWTASVECRFAGKPVRLSISTGSPHAITFNPDAVKRLGLWDAPGPFYARGGRYLGDSIEVRVRRAPGDLELGGVRIATPVVGLRDPAKQLADVYWTDGTIGMDVLRRFDVVFDPRRDTSWLRPVLPAEAPWTYDRAGFQVEPAEGAARIARVDAGSPAASAGLKVGDVIATNAQNVAKLMAAQSMPAGTKIELPIVRDGQKMRIAIVNAERL